jgi:hypothetical protein
MNFAGSQVRRVRTSLRRVGAKGVGRDRGILRPPHIVAGIMQVLLAAPIAAGFGIDDRVGRPPPPGP